METRLFVLHAKLIAFLLTSSEVELMETLIFPPPRRSPNPMTSDFLGS